MKNEQFVLTSGLFLLIALFLITIMALTGIYMKKEEWIDGTKAVLF